MSFFEDIGNNRVQFFDQKIRYVSDINEDMWFCLSDACFSFGYKKPDTINKDKNIVKYIRQLKDLNVTHTIKGNTETRYISEPGLYMLILRSNKPLPMQFVTWICQDVIISTRQTGAYCIPDEARKSTNVAELLTTLETLKKENERLRRDLKKEIYPNGGLVYVIEHETVDRGIVYRIGMTKNMNKRKSSHDTHTLHRNKVVHMVKYDPPNKLEMSVRAALYDYRYMNRRDFYMCPLETIIRIMDMCYKNLKSCEQVEA